MPLANGTTIGPYEITGWIGAGGMGEVYRARDPRLGRDVALKLIAEGFAADAGRVQRFEHEARAAGRLNHPNILAVYDAEVSNGRPFIVSELLEGESLRDRLRAGALPARKAIDYAKQLADGLAAAHDKGIVHRDLKPDNIFITNDGRIKILDFGLAKLTQSDTQQTRTAAGQETEPGAVLGTAGYMSPEQVRGEPVDARSDLFSFGTILYEMLTGKSPFARKTGVEMMAAILNEDPPEALDAVASPAVAQVVHRCLEKSLEARFQSARDLAFALQFVSSASSQSGKSIGFARRGSSRLMWGIGAVAVLAIAVALGSSLRRAPAVSTPTRVMADLGAPGAIPPVSAQFGDMIGLSRDGSMIAFVAQAGPDDPQMIYVRALTDLEARPVVGTENGSHPFFSPDSKWIGFFADGELRKGSIAGGPVQRLASASDNRGGAWADDGYIYFSPERMAGSVVWRVAESGGDAAPFTKLLPGATINIYPQVLPRAKALIYTSSATPGNYNDSDIVLQPLPSGAPKIIQSGGYYGRVTTSGHLLFIHDGTLMTTALDVAKAQVIGAPTPALTGVRGNTLTGGAQFAISDTGLLAYLPGPSVGGNLPMQLMDRDSRLTPLKGEFKNWMDVSFSPDGERLAMSIRDRGADIWIYELARETLTRLTTDPANHVRPKWSADGKRIAYSITTGSQPMNMVWRMADASGTAEPIIISDRNQQPSAFHPSGRFLAFEEFVTEANVELLALPIEGSEGAWKFGSPIVIANGPAREYDAAFSPDGKWVAYASEETGRQQVYVTSFPELKQRRQISNTTGRTPVWSPKGDEVIYADGNQLMSVSMKVANGVLQPGRPQPWAEGRVAFRGPSRMFDLHPSGQRVVLAPAPAPRSGGDVRVDKAGLIFNFFEELRRIAPVR